jgi:hypothetical protein
MFFKVSNLDQRIRRPKGHADICRAPATGHAPISAGCVMPEYQPVSSVHLSAIERPACPACNRNRMLLSKLEAGPPGFDYRTFECQKCGRVETTVVASGPMTPVMRGWLAGELKPPT